MSYLTIQRELLEDLLKLSVRVIPDSFQATDSRIIATRRALGHMERSSYRDTDTPIFFNTLEQDLSS